jgi:hypothetical protein
MPELARTRKPSSLFVENPVASTNCKRYHIAAKTVNEFKTLVVGFFNLKLKMQVKHAQVWTKVNAQVDRGVAGLVSLFSRIEDLETLSSCEGRKGRHDGFLYFCCGDWRTAGAICFDFIAAALKDVEGWSVSLEVFNDSRPMGKLRFRADQLHKVSSTLKLAFSVRKSGCFRDKECKGPRN